MPLIAFAPVESDLSGPAVDARLAQGWFPYGQRWMTCRIWPTDFGEAHDTVWVRVRLAPERPHERLRRLGREGVTVEWASRPRIKGEHQALYERFRQLRHPDWDAEVAWALLLHEGDAPAWLWTRTREIAVRDASGELIAYRWFLHGKDAIAGIACVYDPTRAGLGTIARGLADRWALEQGISWSYPGYVRPGHEAPWGYKLRPGRTEWLDADTGQWRPWEGEGPATSALTLAEMRRQLDGRGLIQGYPRWVVPMFNPASRELPAPYYVAAAQGDEGLRVTTWDPERRCHVDWLTRPLDGPRLEVITAL